MNVHRKKSTTESKGKREQKLYAAYVLIFRFSKYFQRSKQKLNINFSLELDRPKNLKTISALTESTDLKVKALKK
jgi:hypothetical protein